MDNTALISRPLHALAVLVLGLASANVLALPEFGNNTNYPGTPGAEPGVNQICFPLNGTKPYDAYTSYGVSHCNLCHNPNNRSISRLPEWDWTKAGDAGRQNFCVVQGIISSPATNLTVSQGGTVNLSARGFSPRGATSPLTYTWHFSDGRPDIVQTPTPGNATSVNNVPLPNVGDLTITLTASDSTGGIVEADLTPDSRVITVSNAPTVANPDSYTVQSSSTLEVTSKTGVLSNDTGVGTLTATLGTNVAQGALSFSPNGSFSYTSNVGYVGPDSFTYTASNGVASSAPATVTINVTAAPPVANADSYSVQPGVQLTVAAPGVLANDTGTGTLTAVLGTNVTKGALALNANGSFNYTPAAGFTGIDSFTYKANNGSIDSAPATVKLEVGTCTDKDKDGYSPEGGSCGPVDCNDRHPAIKPSAKELCGNKLDDDCNGKIDQADPACTGADCIGARLANQVVIDSAAWSQGKLTVTGSKAAVGATVNLTDAINGTALGSTTVAYNGTWKVEVAIASSANAPCRVQAAINSATGVRTVNGTTADCSSNNGAPPSCGL